MGSSGTPVRALGSQGSGDVAAGDFAWGILFQNNWGIATRRSSLMIVYMGKQWSNSGAVAQQALMCYYKSSMNMISNLEPNVNTTWTAASAFNFSSPVSGGGSVVSLNGNAAANRTAISATLSFRPHW